MDLLKFKKGLEENLPKELEKDTFYISTDAKKLRLNDTVWEDTDEIKKIINENEKVIAKALNNLQSKITVKNITYNELKTLCDNSQLSVSSKYRIIDYVTTTKQAETKSANHPFDIIVEALTPNILSENAIAIQNSGDTYFNDNKLEHWEIKYCIHNDTSRFAWADETNGKGVIYYMKDEFNNEAWYDFKNILFLRNAQWFVDNPNFSTQFSGDTYFYTFSTVDDDKNIKDDTLYTTSYHATDNHLGRSTAKITKLNNTIFIDKIKNGVFNNVIADGHANNTFGQSIWNNVIGHNFTNNIINNSFQYNTISEYFSNNHCWGNFAYNTIEGGCYNNRFIGNVTKCIFKQAYSNNNFTGETLSQCTFGMGNNWISDMPSMTNVNLTNNCIVGTDSVYLNNLYTTDGKNLLQTINEFDGNFEYTILLCDNGKYDVFSHKTMGKISNIYDLGSFEKSGDAEEAAKNPNIATNANINLLKYYIPSINKTGIIEQLVKDGETIQIISWDGLRKYRKLQFQIIGGYQTLVNNPSWEEIKFITQKEWENVKFDIVKPLLSDPNLDFESQSNNIDCYGYVGTLENINVNGDNILIDTIGVYVREGKESPNIQENVWCRLLKFVNNQWKVIYQSDTSKNIGQIAPENLFTFKMVKKDADALIKYNDKIAITYVSAENADVLSGVQLGFKCVNKPGYLQSILTNNSNGNNTYAPAFVIGYLPTATKDHVTVNTNQTISGTKTFNNNINISKDNNVKTVISSNIDGGELKVLHNNSSKGFIVRTKNSSDSILPLEILTTNGSASYQYNFPKTNGNIPVGVKINNTIVTPTLNDGIIDLGTDYVLGSELENALNKIENELENLTFDSLIKVTYDELVTLRNNNELIAGMKYRITDYVTTTAQENTQSAGHQFDIIVEALSENTLSEDAKAIQNENDEYFDESNLEAWELKYCLDNDTSRFAWAVTANIVVNSENVNIIDTLITNNEFNEPFLPDYYIYIDTAGNNFNRYVPEEDGMRTNDFFIECGRETSPDGLENQLCIYKNDLNDENYIEGGAEEGVDYADKFFYWGTEEVDGIIYDKWKKSEVDYGWNITENVSNIFILTQRITTGEINLIEGNKGKGVIYYMKDEWNNEAPYDFKNIKFYREEQDSYVFTFSWINENNEVEDLTLRQDLLSDDEIAYGTHDNIIKSYYQYGSLLCLALNDIVFINTYDYDGGWFYGCYSNTFGNGCYDNTFGNDCHFNIFGNECWRNTFGNYCYSNTFGNGCHYNTFGNSCYSNTFGNECGSNTFGNYYHFNTFGNSCHSNTFGNECYSNTFGNNCYSNTFGDDCNSNTFGDYCYSNTFGNECSSNTFGNYCYSNTFGNGCNSNTFGIECNNNTFGNECGSNTFGNDCNNNTFGIECIYNTFGGYCYSNTFDDYCYYNTFGNECGTNTFGNSCHSNTFGNDCNNNTFGIECNYNTFGDGCYDNTFGDTCQYNTFGNECNSNTFGNDCNSNTFGNSCHSNTFGNYCNYDIFGDNCGSNTFGDYCDSNTFGDYCNYNRFGNSCDWIAFYDDSSYEYKNGKYTYGGEELSFITNISLGNRCRYLLFYPNSNLGTIGDDNMIKNITATKGVNGERGSNGLLTLEIPITNNEYELKIARNSNGDIKMYCEADLIQ